MSVQAVNDENFAEQIRKSGKTLVEFGAVWCPPCKALLPVLDELSKQYGDGLSVLKVNCDESPGAASRFGVMSMPTVILFQDGEPVERLVGLRSKNVYENVLARYA
ncbi:thioredoxin [Paenibacillus sp. UNCCL117]|uniref:thioredoxin family protein n=1 Tax=unclassified Paenibacillus TaxID=185978 RepID=UPI00088433E6|nr:MULTISPECIES: thioredoxin family protein [unclassified Paenibacillus]SDE01864.1 thioredoxin [Paenibacillus sp. cl123]SFW57093.1 thioredoxin [Paenibacillus sp. UNCCL117]